MGNLRVNERILRAQKCFEDYLTMQGGWYTPGFTHDDAVREIEARRGTHFDPDVVDAFLANEESTREIASTNGLG
jgi:HD-GYP domain-containing protein (c-di-GMP phosphodiesterase class II)